MSATFRFNLTQSERGREGSEKAGPRKPEVAMDRNPRVHSLKYADFHVTLLVSRHQAHTTLDQGNAQVSLALDLANTGFGFNEIRKCQETTVSARLT